MKIAIFGVGYVGLVSGTCFAEMGIEVSCCDIDQGKIDGLSNGVMPIYEHGLAELVQQNAEAGRLGFTTDMAAALDGASACFICVGTPMSDSGEANLQYIESVARGIGQLLNDYTVVVVKSTVPVGTCQKVKSWVSEELSARGVDLEFSVASNPEFLKEGVAVNDFMKPDRVVIGVADERSEAVLKDIYATFIRIGLRIYTMDIASAEMTKYASNCFLATKISFINEIANICEHAGADVEMVRQAMGADKRIGHQFLFPGVGYGGSCFPKDIKALISSSKKMDYTPRILESVEAVNDDQKNTMYNKICQWCAREGIKLSDLTCAIWGLAFKPNTDDIRESPGLALANLLTADGVHVRANDPKAIAASQSEMAGNNLVSFHDDQYDALEGADVLCIMTEWRPYRHPDAELMFLKLGKKVIFDGRNILFEQMSQYDDVTVIGIGRSLNA